METTKDIHAEIHQTIIDLCGLIQLHVKEGDASDVSGLVKATAELIQSTKERGVF